MAQPQWVTLPGFSAGFLDPEFHDHYGDEFQSGLRDSTNFILNRGDSIRQRPKLARTGVGWESTWNDDHVVIIPIQDTNSTDKFCVVAYRSNTARPGYVYEYNLVLVNITDGTTTALSTPRAWLGAYTVPGIFADVTPGISHVQFGESTFILLSGTPPLRLVNTAAGTFSLEDVDWYTELPGLWHFGQKIDFSTVLTQTDPPAAQAEVPLLEGDTVQITVGGTTISGVIHKFNGTPKFNTSAGVAGSLWVKACTSVDGTISLIGAGAATIVKAGAAVYTGTVSGSSRVFMTSEMPKDLVDDTGGSESTVRVYGSDYTVTTSTLTDYSFQIDEAWTLGAAENMQMAVKNEDTGSSPYKCHACTIYQGRLVIAGNWDDSDQEGRTRMYFSSSRDPFVIEPNTKLEPDPSSPIELDLTLGAEDDIQWISGGDTLFIGGSAKEYAEMNPNPVSNTPEGLPRFALVGDNGSNKVSPFEVFDGRAFFAPKNGGALEMFQYDFDTRRYKPQNIIRGSQTLFGSMTNLAYRGPTSSDPLGRILALNSDNSLVMGSFPTLEQRPAWHPLEHDGSYKVHALTSLDDEFYMVVERTVDGDMTIAKFAFDDWDYTVDMQVTASGSGTSWTIPAADQPQFTNGVYPAIAVVSGAEMFVGYVTITSNAFTTPLSVTSVVVGHKFDSKFTPLTSKAIDQLGAGQNRKRRIVKANIRLKDTSQVRVDGELLLQDYPQVMEQELPTTTGVVEKVCTGWSYDPTIEFEGEIPYNATIVSINLKVAV